MMEFRDAVDTCGFRNIPYCGYGYTYDNGQPDECNRQSRLERALANEAWCDLFPRSKLVNLEREWSDHAPIKLILDYGAGPKVRSGKIFRFEHIWIEEEGCEDVVRKAWENGSSFSDRMRSCTEMLEYWKGGSFGWVFKELEKKKRRRLKRLNEGRRSERFMRERKKLVAEIAHLLQQEERF
ncbi:hypothetical protein RND81_08G110800 [Saponaria officinalis]|uniref:Uncharacterized protein n=1 Tax=Saponaria officinalis TaxID=3572 RepID=A0AAW1J637_SAPOF